MNEIVNYNHEIEKNVSRETFLLLGEFKQLLLKWNKVHNLTSRATISEMHIDELIADSLSLQGLITKGSSVLDIGSGGGFPGLVLAILGHNIDLVERNFKKTVFLNESKRLLKLLNCRIYNVDVRELQSKAPYEFICSKAMATVKVIIDLSSKHRNPRTKYVLLKNKNQMVEVEEAQMVYHFNLQVVENKYKNESVVLIISDVQNVKDL